MPFSFGLTARSLNNRLSRLLFWSLLSAIRNLKFPSGFLPPNVSTYICLLSSSCSCTLPLTSTLDGVGGESHAPAALPPAQNLVMLRCLDITSLSFQRGSPSQSITLCWPTKRTATRDKQVCNWNWNSEKTYRDLVQTFQVRCSSSHVCLSLWCRYCML